MVIGQRPVQEKPWYFYGGFSDPLFLFFDWERILLFLSAAVGSSGFDLKARVEK
jgi:hypothetical protein